MYCKGFNRWDFWKLLLTGLYEVYYQFKYVCLSKTALLRYVLKHYPREALPNSREGFGQDTLGSTSREVPLNIHIEFWKTLLVGRCPGLGVSWRVKAHSRKGSRYSCWKGLKKGKSTLERIPSLLGGISDLRHDQSYSAQYILLSIQRIKQLILRAGKWPKLLTIYGIP